MKVYKFTIHHFCHSDTVYVLAETKKQAIEIVMKKVKNSYDFVSNCLDKIYEKPQILLDIEDTD